MANVSRYMFQAAAGAGGGPSYFALITTGNGIQMDSDFRDKNIRSFNRDGNGGFFAGYNVRESNTVPFTEHGYMLHFNNLGEVLLSQLYNGASGQEASDNICDVIPNADQYLSLYYRIKANFNRYSDSPSVVATNAFDTITSPFAVTAQWQCIKTVSSTVAYAGTRNGNADGASIIKFNPSSGISSPTWFYANASVGSGWGVAAVDVDSSGNPFFWYNAETGSTFYDTFGVFKYNSSGTRQWGYVNNTGNNCSQISMGNGVVTSQDRPTLLLNQGSPLRADTIVFSNAGSNDFEKTLYYSDSTNCCGVALDEDSSNNLYVLVQDNDTYDFNGPQYVYKINSSGTVTDSISIAYSSGYFGTNNFYGRRVRVDETDQNPGLLIAGYQVYSSGNYRRPAVIRIPLDFSLISSSGSWTFGTPPTLSVGNPDPTRPDLQQSTSAFTSSVSTSSVSANTSQLTSTTTSLTEF